MTRQIITLLFFALLWHLPASAQCPLTFTAIQGICANAPGTVIALPGFTTYEWSSGETTNIINPATPGVYTVTVTIPNNCTASASVTVTPTYDTYLWSTGETTPAISVSQPGAYSVTVSNGGSCTASTTVVVAQNPLPTVSFSVDNSDVCVGSCRTITATFVGTPPFNLTVQTPDGTISDEFPSTTGSFVVCVQQGAPPGGFSGSFEASFEEILVLGDSTVLLAGERLSPQFTFEAFAMRVDWQGNVLWTRGYPLSGNPPLNTFGSAFVEGYVAPDGNAVLAVDLQSAQGIAKIAPDGNLLWYRALPVLMVLRGWITPELDGSGTLLGSGTISSQPLSDLSYLATFDANGQLTAPPSVLQSSLSTFRFFRAITDALGNRYVIGYLNQLSTNIIILKFPPGSTVPEWIRRYSIAPSSSAYYGAETFDRLRVFNRWGQLVFETEDYQDGWDGTSNGALAPSDVYIWVLDAQMDPVLRKGDVTLLR